MTDAQPLIFPLDWLASDEARSVRGLKPLMASTPVIHLPVEVYIAACTSQRQTLARSARIPGHQGG
jgi:hypothetical protein